MCQYFNKIDVEKGEERENNYNFNVILWEVLVCESILESKFM